MGKQRREGRLKLDGSIHDFHWRYPSGNENTYPPYQPAPTWVDDFPNFLFGGRCDCSLEDILCWFFWTGIFSNVCLGKQMCVNKCLILYQGQQRGNLWTEGFLRYLCSCLMWVWNRKFMQSIKPFSLASFWPVGSYVVFLKHFVAYYHDTETTGFRLDVSRRFPKSSSLRQCNPGSCGIFCNAR